MICSENESGGDKENDKELENQENEKNKTADDEKVIILYRLNYIERVICCTIA